MPLDWKSETRICKLKSCSTSFAPTQYRQVFCTKECHKKSIAADFPEQKCGVRHCNTIFKPRHRYLYCSPECLQYARRPANTTATLARQKLNKKGVYMTEEQFREKLLATNPLKCTQEKCIPGCRIRGMEQFGCVA